MSAPTADPRLVGFRRHLRPEVIAGEATYVFSERGVTAVQARQLEALAPLLDGTRDLTTLLHHAPPGVTPAQITALVRRLTEAGLLSARMPAAAGADAQALAYWESAGLDGDDALATLGGAPVSVASVGGADDAAVLTACAEAGLSPSPYRDGAAADGTVTGGLTVVLCADYLDADLERIDREHRAAGRPWLLARPVGSQVWIGPFFGPDSACWHCLAHRLWIHRRAEAHVQRTLGRRGPATRPSASIAPLRATGAHLVALEAAKWLAGHRYAGQQAVWTLDSLDLRGRHHELRARPQCGTCGDPGLVDELAGRPVIPVSRFKHDKTGGGHRSEPPEQVLTRYQHLISPVTGVVREIRRDPRGPAFLNSFRAGANLAIGAHGLDDLRNGLRAEHGGKGVTAAHAEVSALCEALERHSGSFHGDERRIRASLCELGDDAIHPNTVQLYDRRQFVGREQWNDRHASFQYVAEEFDEQAPVDWTPVWSMTGSRQRLLPTAMLYYGTPAEGNRGLIRADSNGNAAGSSLEDAVLQGFFELVERDAVALWWYNRTRMPAVDLATAGDPWVDEVRRVHRGLRRDVWVLDVTSDLGVPAMVAMSRRTDKPAEDIVFGFGAHFDPRVAVRRALTEVNQLLPAVVDVDAGGGGYACEAPEAMRWWRGATVANQPYLRPAAEVAPRDLGGYGYTPRADLRDDVWEAERIVAAKGMELLVLDQTRPDVGLPVVKVIVPGLRHFWSRFGPGRLYDVPVAMGLLERPTAMEDLNPVSLFV